MTLLMFLPSSDKLTMVSSHELQDQVLQYTIVEYRPGDDDDENDDDDDDNDDDDHVSVRLSGAAGRSLTKNL